MTSHVASSDSRTAIGRDLQTVSDRLYREHIWGRIVSILGVLLFLVDIVSGRFWPESYVAREFARHNLMVAIETVMIVEGLHKSMNARELMSMLGISFDSWEDKRFLGMRL